MNVSFFVDNDLCWNLNVLKKTIPILEKNGFNVKCIWLLPKKISNKYGFQVTLWWLTTFGLINFLKLTFFYLLVITKNKINNCNNFNQLKSSTKIKCFHIKNPNEKSVISFIKKNKIKYSFSLSEHIYKEKILKIPNHVILNKHSSLLPSFKGLLPYFWSIIKKKKNGVTIHLINKNIDSGKIVFQKKINKKFLSMVNFYIYISNNYPYYLINAINNLKRKKFIRKKYQSSYYSMPNRQDYQLFSKIGGRVIRFYDIFNFKNLAK